LLPGGRLPSLSGTMALRLHLSPRAARALSLCPAGLRERLERELAQLLCGRSSAPREAAAPTAEAGVAESVLLGAGLRLRYRLDRAAGRLHLLELGGPWLSGEAHAPQLQA
jgi:hypothetical protein